MLEAIARDVRFAARGLRRSPGFAAAAVLTFALGIGATTVVFSVLYGILFRPLPFPNAERLVQIVQHVRSAGRPEPFRAGLTPNQFAALQEGGTTRSAIGLYTGTTRTLTGVPVPMRLSGAAISPGLLGGLGVTPALGRTLSLEDGYPGADPVVVLSHRTWVRYFGADPGILERRIALDDEDTRVVGVMPEGFGFPSLAGPFPARNSAGELHDAPEYWLPVRPFDRRDESEGFSILPAFALLDSGVTPDQALAELRAALPPMPAPWESTVEIVPARREMVRRLEPVLATFQLGVLLILLIACVNIVNLLLTRAVHHRREIAVRMALGASRAGVARASIVETLILALAGGGLACVLAYGGLELLRSLPPHVLPRLRELRIDGNVLLFAAAMSVATGCAVGLFAALRATRATAAGHALAALGWRGASAPRRLRPSAALVVIEIAATMTLLATAALVINSAVRLARVDPGFAAEGALTFRVTLPASRYPTATAQQSLASDLLVAVRALPGVTAAAVTGDAIGSTPIAHYPLRVDGEPALESAEVTYRTVSAGYLRTLGLPLREGREFDERDRTAATSPVLVNEAFVQRYVQGGSALGREFTYFDGRRYRIVGVAADARDRLADGPEPTLFLLAGVDAPLGQPTFVLRASGEPAALLPALREIVRRTDPQLAIYDGMPLDDLLMHGVASPRLYGLVSLACALLALLLAGIGLYGVLAHAVSTRMQELGIRMALGADARRLVSRIVGQGLTLTVTGVALGLAGAFYASGFIESLLFELTPHDPATYVAATAMFFAVALLACALPARRATRVDPVVALRAE